MTETKNLSAAHADAYRDIFAERGPFAFVAVTPYETIPGIHAALGIAEANKPGYYPVPLGWARFARFEDAETEADRLNHANGLSDDDAFRIAASTMGGRRYTSEPQET